MTIMVNDAARPFVGAFPAACLAGSLACFAGAALSDWAYASSYEIQWTNFASWLLVGGLVLSAVALVFAVRDVATKRRRHGAGVAYAVVLLLAWALGFHDALVHARDAWATMPAGLVHSVIVAVLVFIATWMAFRAWPTGGRP